MRGLSNISATTNEYGAPVEQRNSTFEPKNNSAGDIHIHNHYETPTGMVI